MTEFKKINGARIKHSKEETIANIAKTKSKIKNLKTVKFFIFNKEWRPVITIRYEFLIDASISVVKKSGHSNNIYVISESDHGRFWLNWHIELVN